MTDTKTITQLKADIDSNLKLEGFSEIYRGVILKYMDIAYTIGQRDQISEYQKELPELFAGTRKALDDLTNFDSDPNDPDTWDEDEYQDNMSDLVNRSHEASEGMER